MAREDQQQQSQQRRKRRTRVVSFKPTVVVHRKGLNLNDYTDEEIASSWYTWEEQEEMGKDIQRTVTLLDQQLSSSSATTAFSTNQEESITHCSRGVESWTRTGAREKFGRRQVARTAVLETQEVYQGEVDKDVRIAQVYSKHTKTSIRSAYVRGIQDEDDVWMSVRDCGKGRSYVSSEQTTLLTMRSFKRSQRI